MFGVQDAKEFIDKLREEADTNARSYKTMGVCIIIWTALMAIGDLVFHSLPLVVIIIGVLTIAMGTLQTFLTFFGYHKQYKNCMNAKQLTEKLIIEYLYKLGDFKEKSKEDADGIFATKYQGIKTSYENGVSEIMDDINQLINK